MRYSILVVICLLFALLSKCSSHQILTNIGYVQGTVVNSEYVAYVNIPYGKVDASNYFGIAEPYPVSSNGYVNATLATPAVRCPQIYNGAFVGQLDCLTLNVYTPTTANNTSALPVMVFIHGGGFDQGSSEYDRFGPRFLVKHDILLVTINYRLSPYGFMCVDDVDVTGNQGLKDQHLALKWIQNNIEGFGGNAGDITVYGMSAGGHSVDFHLLSERERVFNKVIIQSGTSLTTTLLQDVDKEAPLKIATHLGLEASDVYNAIRTLSYQDPEKVVSAARELGLSFKPCAERAVEGVEPFITHDWVKAPVLNIDNISILIGNTEHEVMNNFIKLGAESFSNNLILLNMNKTFDFNEERSERMVSYLKRFYMGDAEVGPDTVWPIINLNSDLTYIHPIQRSIAKYLEGNANSIYYYMFSYSGGRNLGKIESNVTAEGAAHADDLGYLFDNSRLPETITNEDQLMIDRMTTMWTNFAKYGDPTPDTSTLLPVKWLPLDSGTYNYLRIDADITLERRPLNRRMAFLDLFFRHNSEYLRTFENVGSDDDEVDGSHGVMVSATLLSFIIPLFRAMAFM